ncbi:hypothetical protein PRN20_18435 [Devosia sp. ZB163]|uniref:hypothetical protein n=1 Tax=Devosia sp. ZB163 TaxID=3025938 RepID=UPI00235E301B|nr:hypothetical protein [Devosia sp. ZB163]MDC9825716.1 hypothetical protein [Devosia sp. ZB163]
MTSVGTVSQSMSYAQILASAQKSQQATAGTAASTSGSSGSSATSVTLSDAAKAALAEKSFATVTTEARATLDKLLSDAKLTSPLKDGKLALDLSKVDRRELYAMSTNSNQLFTADEQKAAAIELQNRFDQALAGPTAVGRVTGSVKGLYVAALAYFDAMGPEEKASAAYVDQRAALEEMLKQIEAKPSTLPGAVPNDPINAYMERLATGETGKPRDIANVAADARTTLDAQYKATGSSKPDYSEFDSRSLASVALNSADKFSPTEVRAASQEMRSRSGAALLQSLKSAGNGNPAGFAQNVISLYGAMSSEERAAAGWSENLYNAAVANYQTASKLGSILGQVTGSSAFGSSSGDEGRSMSLMDYL